MKIYIRTNVNKNIGLGHLSRCSRLIKYFNYKGFNCEIFLDHPGSLDYFFFNIRDKIKINYLYNKKELFLDQKDDAN